MAPFSAFWIPQMISSTYLPCWYLNVPLGPDGVMSHQQLNQWGVQGDPVQAKSPWAESLASFLWAQILTSSLGILGQVPQTLWDSGLFLLFCKARDNELVFIELLVYSIHCSKLVLYSLFTSTPSWGGDYCCPYFLGEQLSRWGDAHSPAVCRYQGQVWSSGGVELCSLCCQPPH